MTEMEDKREAAIEKAAAPAKPAAGPSKKN